MNSPGRPSLEMRRLMEEVRENVRRWQACPKHRFATGAEGVRLGDRVRCEACGVDVSLLDAATYVRGYMAAGGDPEEVFPGWGRRYGGAGQGSGG